MIKAIVTDIEGTTTSLSFVKDVLFPYARAHIADFVRARSERNDIKRLLEDVGQETGRTMGVEEAITQLIDWIDEDRKATPLKSLQGLIWDDGYRQGAFKGHVYDDAADALKGWKQQGVSLYVYSSGSVHAQKLLFGHTAYGDLTTMFSGYFDTHIGAKRETQSYRAIAERIQFSSEEILFLSDIREELDAAAAAGFNTCWLVREQAEIDPDAAHRQARHFGEIDLTAANAR